MLLSCCFMVYSKVGAASKLFVIVVFAIFKWFNVVHPRICMPRTKGSKNRPKTNTNYSTQIAEKQETIASLNTEIVSIQKAIEEQKNTLKEKKTALKKAEKEVASLEAKKAKADAKAAEEAKKAEAEAVLKKLLASGMSADEILEKLK